MSDWTRLLVLDAGLLVLAALAVALAFLLELRHPGGPPQPGSPDRGLDQ